VHAIRKKISGTICLLVCVWEVKVNETVKILRENPWGDMLNFTEVVAT